ncbi:tetratricopeptide repeat protein [Halarcobacter sp.]|uniref:tetratricopeptide repeat protein n=1 Tax=Halarcobacter sp. TaxID=2321133 RepID=UPI003A93BCEE
MAKEINLKQFLQIFKDQANNNLSTNKYCFLLGAGASVSSNIPSGESLAKKWFNEIKNILDEEELMKWKKEKKIDEEDLASSYSSIYEKRFEVNKAEGYFEIQRNLENKEPSIGYAYLGKILAESNHKFVITTNFDSLIEDSLFLYTNSKPLVCGHESLASYIDTHTNRPTIVKIHRDVLLEPFSEKETIDELKKQWKEALKPLVSNFHLVVIGYAGNDGSLMDYLSDIEDRKNIYWCKRESSSINEKINDLLSDNDFIVNIEGFDSLMIEIKSSLDLNNIKTSDIRDLAEKRMNKFEEQEKKFADKLNKNDSEVTDAIKSTLPDWIKKYYEIEKEKDIEKKNLLYRESINDFEELYHYYAIFLTDIKKDYEEAENYYKKALDLDPNDVSYNGNYAIFLKNIKKDYEEAEIYYKKALDLDPNDAVYNGNYALFLNEIKKDYKEAENYYKKALDLDPNNANCNGNYAIFLITTKKDYENAEKYYKKALERNPNNANCNGNYASLLFIKGEKKLAKKYLENSFKLNENENENNSDLALELWFYVLAHFQERFTEAKEKLDELLVKGYKSIGWDFSQNIERAKEDGHFNIEELEKYAKLITEE